MESLTAELSQGFECEIDDNDWITIEVDDEDLVISLLKDEDQIGGITIGQSQAQNLIEFLSKCLPHLK